VASLSAPHAADRFDTVLRRGWPVILAGLLAYGLCLRIGGSTGLWLPALGVGIAVTLWTSAWLLPLLAVETVVVGLFPSPDASAPAAPSMVNALDALLLAGQVALSWWAVHTLARGSRWLEEPRSCMLFLVLVPGLISAGFALTKVLLWTHVFGLYDVAMFWPSFGRLWASRTLGLLVPLPLLLVAFTPWLSRRGLIQTAPLVGVQGNPWQRWSTGELIEVGGLSLAAAVLALVLVALTGTPGPEGLAGLPPWSLWGVGLLIVVWSALRQGLRGGALVAGTSAALALLVAEWGPLARDGGPLQGYLLAQSSTALLVGVSAGWIQASETRYRHIVSELPLVLYSTVLPAPLRSREGSRAGRRDSRQESPATIISQEAVVTLVSRASQQVFDCPAEGMTGPYAQWLGRIFPADRELVLAALGQLLLQRQPVACEYRVLAGGLAATSDAVEADAGDNGPVRWVRDTLTPHYTEDGFLDGWEGFIEDITERRRSSYSAHQSSLVLQAVVSGLPVGVFVVGPQGFPLFSNPRARQLLGQREDAAVPLPQLSRQYRLHRPDGSEYPPEELPVSRALRNGIACSAADIIVHRADGRRIHLASWAAPVSLGESGRSPAAVWVLEDIAELKHADTLRHRTNGRQASEPSLQELPGLLQQIHALTTTAQHGLSVEHPSTPPLRQVLELSNQAGHLAAQVLGKLAARPPDHGA
jgi:PAS domain-containing protein